MFFKKLQSHGEFKCIKDRRRYNKRKIDRYQLAAYNLHFGHCKNNFAHDCEFVLDKFLNRELWNYYRLVITDGKRKRFRSKKPIKLSGRGRKKSITLDP